MIEFTETDLQMAADLFKEMSGVICAQNPVAVEHTTNFRVRNVADSITLDFKNLSSQTYNNINDKLKTGAALLSRYINTTTGNSLSEVYIRVRRLFFHHCTSFKTVFPTWVTPSDLNQRTREDDGVLTFEEDLIYGFQFPLDKIHVNYPWNENIIAMWEYGSTSLLTIKDYNQMSLQAIQKKLDTLLEMNAICPDKLRGKEITKMAPKANLRKWWALVQVVFNCPLDNLWWYPGISIIRWLPTYRRWEVGYLQPHQELRPVTTLNMARNIETVWRHSNWVEIIRK